MNILRPRYPYCDRLYPAGYIPAAYTLNCTSAGSLTDAQGIAVSIKAYVIGGDLSSRSDLSIALLISILPVTPKSSGVRFGTESATIERIAVTITNGNIENLTWLERANVCTDRALIETVALQIYDELKQFVVDTDTERLPAKKSSGIVSAFLQAIHQIKPDKNVWIDAIRCEKIYSYEIKPLSLTKPSIRIRAPFDEIPNKDLSRQMLLKLLSELELYTLLGYINPTPHDVYNLSLFEALTPDDIYDLARYTYPPEKDIYTEYLFELLDFYHRDSTDQYIRPDEKDEYLEVKWGGEIYFPQCEHRYIYPDPEKPVELTFGKEREYYQDIPPEPELHAVQIQLIVKWG